MGRGHVELVHVDDIEPAPLPGSGWPEGALARVLSRDSDTGAWTGVVELPPGWRRGQGHYGADVELLVLAGTLRIGDDVRAFGWFDFSPAGSTQRPWAADPVDGCTLLLAPRSGPPDFRAGPGDDPPGRIELDSDLVPWRGSPIPGPPPGIVHRVLRHDAATGLTTALYAGPWRRDYRKLEFHDCDEEVFLIEGSIWLGNSGTMRPGSYFWRPQYLTHGPIYAARGNFAFLHVTSSLVNHFTDDPRSSPERNREQAAREEPPRNYIAEAGT